MKVSQKVGELNASELSVERFLTDYVARNRPILVKGALNRWDLTETWTPTSLERRFGNEFVQVYNSYFDLQKVMPLKQYLKENFGGTFGGHRGLSPYVRWYTKLRDIDFFWADAAFARLQSAWHSPDFLPSAGYVFPRTPEGGVSNPVTDFFPAKGLFISPRGARTSLHVDPWESCAVLCQLYGTKRWYFYAPEQSDFLVSDFGIVDVAEPDLNKFPNFPRAEVTAVCTLHAGEVIYIPRGWYHHVECESDSVSLTWNFVHKTTANAFGDWLRKGKVSELDESVLRFFYGVPAGTDVASGVLDKLL